MLSKRKYMGVLAQKMIVVEYLLERVAVWKMGV